VTVKKNYGLSRAREIFEAGGPEMGEGDVDDRDPHAYDPACEWCGKRAREIDSDSSPEDIFTTDLEGETYCDGCSENHGEWECLDCGGDCEVVALVQSPVALEPRMERCARCDGSGREGFVR